MMKKTVSDLVGEVDHLLIGHPHFHFLENLTPEKGGTLMTTRCRPEDSNKDADLKSDFLLSELNLTPRVSDQALRPEGHHQHHGTPKGQHPIVLETAKHLREYHKEQRP